MWQGKTGRGRFVFGLLPENLDLSDDVSLLFQIDRSTRALRAALNRVGHHLELPFPLSMHVARHSFAVKALNSGGVSVHMISRLLGHSSVTVTEKVYATFLFPTLAEAVRRSLTFSQFGIVF